MSFHTEELVFLEPEAELDLLDWCEELVNHGIDLYEPNHIWSAAGYLVGLGLADDIANTAVILTFASQNWHEIKRVLIETE